MAQPAPQAAAAVAAANGSGSRGAAAPPASCRQAWGGPEGKDGPPLAVRVLVLPLAAHPPEAGGGSGDATDAGQGMAQGRVSEPPSASVNVTWWCGKHAGPAASGPGSASGGPAGGVSAGSGVGPAPSGVVVLQLMSVTRGRR